MNRTDGQLFAIGQDDAQTRARAGRCADLLDWFEARHGCGGGAEEIARAIGWTEDETRLVLQQLQADLGRGRVRHSSVLGIWWMEGIA